MLRYEFIGNNVISVKLYNSYSVIAISKKDRDEDCYYISLYLKGDTYDTLDLIEQKDHVRIEADVKEIVNRVAEMITDLNHDGFFDYYIKRYEYMMNCFDKGNELFEEIGVNDKFEFPAEAADTVSKAS